MANPIVDASKAKYFPEMLIEGLNEPTVSVAGQRVAGYIFDDRRCVVENINVEAGIATMDMVVSADSAEKCRITTNVPTVGDDRHIQKIVAKETLDLTLIHTAAGPTANVWSRWNMTFRKPMPVDKIREDKQLDTEEIPIADMTHLEDFLSLGTIGYNQSLMNIDPNKMFEEIVCVDRMLPVIVAGGNTVVGGSAINVPNPNSQLIVLLGVMFDNTILATPDDTYICVDRDINANYMRIDTTCMPGTTYVPCYVPAIKKLEVRIESATGIAANECGFIYGVRPLSVGDHLRWALGFPGAPIARSNAMALATRYPDIVKRMQAGLI
jgi:hypothetical protein